MIKNSTKNTIIASKTKLCKSLWAMASGLMFTSPIKDKGLVFFMPKFESVSFHMCFVFYSIDVIFLDDKMKVVELKENFKPFTFYKTKKSVKYAVEVSKGTIKKSKTKLRDLVVF